MKKLVLLTLVFLLACSCLSGCGSSEKEEAKELVIYTWEEYLPEEVLARFEEETGIHIIYTNSMNTILYHRKINPELQEYRPDLPGFLLRSGEQSDGAVRAGHSADRVRSVPRGH